MNAMELKKRALVVDDELDVREYLKEVLDGEGFEVLQAGDGVEALALVLSQEALPTLIISDVQMPKKDGITLLKELKANPQLASIPVILLTGIRERTGISFTAEEIADTIGAEPAAYLEKPISAQELVKTIRTVLGV